MENLTGTNSEDRKIEFDNICINHLNETRKWTMFLSIVGFVVTGIMVLVIVFSFVFIPFNSPSNVNPILSFLPLAVVLVIYFFPIYYMLKFSSHSKKAINELDKVQLSIALKYQKLLFRFTGIFAIIMLSFYIIFGGIALITSVMMTH